MTRIQVNPRHPARESSIVGSRRLPLRTLAVEGLLSPPRFDFGYCLFGETSGIPSMGCAVRTNVAEEDMHCTVPRRVHPGFARCLHLHCALCTLAVGFRSAKGSGGSRSRATLRHPRTEKSLGMYYQPGRFPLTPSSTCYSNTNHHISGLHARPQCPLTLSPGAHDMTLKAGGALTVVFACLGTFLHVPRHGGSIHYVH